MPDFPSEEMGEASFFSQFKMLFPQRVSPSVFLPPSTLHSIPTQFIERSLPCPSFFSSITLQHWRLLSTPCEVQDRMCQQIVSSMAMQSAGCPWWVWTTAASPHEHFLENPYHLQQSPNIGHRPAMVLSKSTASLVMLKVILWDRYDYYHLQMKHPWSSKRSNGSSRNKWQSSGSNFSLSDTKAYVCLFSFFFVKPVCFIPSQGKHWKFDISVTCNRTLKVCHALADFAFSAWNALHALCAWLRIICPSALTLDFLWAGLGSCMLSCFSHFRLFATLWTIACWAPLSVGFSRQEYWIGLPCPPPGDCSKSL